MEIQYLSDNMVFADNVAQWIYDEFIKDIRKGISYEQLSASINDCHKSTLPIRLIAIEEGKCVGTISIVHNDLAYREYTPWLAALYVDLPYRKNKIGIQLVEKVKDIVRSLNYKELYLRTEFASDYYRKRGWQFVESCEDEFGLQPDVFRVTFE